MSHAPETGTVAAVDDYGIIPRHSVALNRTSTILRRLAARQAPATQLYGLTFQRLYHTATTAPSHTLALLALPSPMYKLSSLFSSRPSWLESFYEILAASNSQGGILMPDTIVMQYHKMSAAYASGRDFSVQKTDLVRGGRVTTKVRESQKLRRICVCQCVGVHGVHCTSDLKYVCCRVPMFRSQNITSLRRSCLTSRGAGRHWGGTGTTCMKRPRTRRAW